MSNRDARLQLPQRPRRTRGSEAIRALVRETRLTPEILIYPIFVCEGDAVRRPITSMPGIYQLSVDAAVQEAVTARKLGISGVLLFGLPLLFLTRQWHCRRCDHRFRIESAPARPESPYRRPRRAAQSSLPGKASPPPPNLE